MTTLPWRFGTLSCMLCGAVSGTVKDGVLTLNPGLEPTQTGKGMRCGRCNGGLFFERELSQFELPATEAR